jgi:hypothetical protein
MKKGTKAEDQHTTRNLTSKTHVVDRSYPDFSTVHAGKRDHMCSHCAIQSFSTMWTRYNDHLQIIPFPLKGKQCVILQHSDQPSLLNSRLQSEIAYTGLEKQRKKLKRSLIALT